MKRRKLLDKLQEFHQECEDEILFGRTILDPDQLEL